MKMRFYLCASLIDNDFRVVQNTHHLARLQDNPIRAAIHETWKRLVTRFARVVSHRDLAEQASVFEFLHVDESLPSLSPPGVTNDDA